MTDAPNQLDEIDLESLAEQVNSLTIAQLIEILHELVTQRVQDLENLQSQLDSETDEQKRAEIQKKVAKAKVQLLNQRHLFMLFIDAFPHNLPGDQ